MFIVCIGSIGYSELDNNNLPKAISTLNRKVYEFCRVLDASRPKPGICGILMRNEGEPDQVIPWSKLQHIKIPSNMTALEAQDFFQKYQICLKDYCNPSVIWKID